MDMEDATATDAPTDAADFVDNADATNLDMWNQMLSALP
jgi:hypothetical protein